MRYPLVYEINTRCWLAELGETLGRRITLADVPEEQFALWRHRGFTHIWLMGVWTIGAHGREWSRKQLGTGFNPLQGEDIDGSPYAVQAYRVSRKFGGDAALKKFRKELARYDLRLILDFVPNHTAIDHKWVRDQPYLYVTCTEQREWTIQPHSGAQWFAHGRDPYFSPWEDTLQLDYRNPITRAAVIEELKQVSALCDGVRCDMAMLILNDVFEDTWQKFPPMCEVASLRGAAPTTRRTSASQEGETPADGEFWAEAIRAVRQTRDDFLFIAEVYWGLESRLQSLGFDFTYDKELYDHIVRHDPDAVTEHLAARSLEFVQRSVHFLENHDEPRIASLLTPAEHRAAALLTCGLPGLRLLHEGQLNGWRERVSVHLGRRPVDHDDVEAAALYNQLLGALPQSAVGKGEGELIQPRAAWDENSTHRNIALVQWQSGAKTFDLVVVNLAPQQSQCYAPLAIPGLGDRYWHLRDLFSAETHERDGAALADRGLYLDLAPHAAQLFHFEPAQ